MPKIRTVVINGIHIKCKGNKVEQADNPYVWGSSYVYKEISNQSHVKLKEGSLYKTGSFLAIYNTETRSTFYIKPKTMSIQDIVQSYKEAQAHVWPSLGTNMKPMGFKCNYWDRGFRIEASKIKDYYRIRVFKHSLIEKNFIKRRKPISYKTDYEGLKSVIMEAKLAIL